MLTLDGEREVVEDNDVEDEDTSDDIDNSEDDEVDEDDADDTEDTDDADDADEPEESDEDDEGEEGDKSPVKDGKTSKGTKAADDPLSLANQLRANAESKVKDYEQFLEDPEALERYLADLKKEKGVAVKEKDAPKNDEPEIKPEDIKTNADLQKYLAQERRKDRQEIEAIKKQLSESKEQDTEERTKATISGRIQTVQQKYPQLRPKNPDGSPNPEFDKDLENELGELYQELDFDPKAKKFRGQVDLVRLADRFMKAVQRGSTIGSKKAQTVVVEKRKGKPPGGGADKDAGGENATMTPEQKIAARMRAAHARQFRSR
jgi:hypothetical protein